MFCFFGCRYNRGGGKRERLRLGFNSGRALLPHAEHCIALMRETGRTMSRFTRDLAGKLRLGASPTFGEFIPPRILGAFAREYPPFPSA